MSFKPLVDTAPSAEEEIPPEATPEPAVDDRRRRFRLIDSGQRPAGALTWSGITAARAILSAWRRAVIGARASEARVLRVAWVIADHIHTGHGYAFLGDGYLARESKTDISHVPTVLRLLEDAGAIIRAHVRTASGTTERRIWLAKAILAEDETPATTAGGGTRHGGGKPPAVVAGQRRDREKLPRRDPSLRSTYTARMAQADAEARLRARAIGGHGDD